MYAAVSSAHVTEKKLNAKEWCDHVVASIGKGKGGGKADFANANVAIDASMVATTTRDSILEAAKKYVESKK